MQKVFPFLSWLPLAKTTLKDDIIAGITGTIIVIPQAVAFAMIAGLPPVYGFYTAMVTPIIAALFGSSYHLVTGPTTTSSIVLYAIVSKFVSPSSDLEAYITLAILVSFMAGIIKLFIGVFKMGKLANFVGIVESDTWTSESWTEQGAKAEVLADFKGWHPVISNLIEKADVHFKWALFRLNWI